MAESSSAVAAPLLRGLPDEIAVWEIFVRLPPKSLLRCRAVRRDWRRATSTREFLLAHHGRQPCLPLLYNFDFVPSYLDIVPFDHQADQLQSVARLGDAYFYLEASCDGLLVLCDRNKRLSVCNPATRRYAPLPKTSGFRVLGMYPDNNTGQHRLLLCPEPVGQGACHVFALGSCQPPRNIGIGCPDDVTNALVPVLLGGSLHWHREQRESGSRDLILVFDTTAESFRHMRSPIHGGTSLLFEMDGMLAVYSFNDAAKIIDIWVLQDYQREVWAFKCRVKLPVKEINVQYTSWDVMVTSSDDDVLVLLRFGDRLLHVDINGKLVASFHRERVCLTPLRLKQTLVPHNFFPTLEGGIVIDSPFI
ncbi:unnamed protein product [Alopecurus aequalis]